MLSNVLGMVLIFCVVWFLVKCLRRGIQSICEDCGPDWEDKEDAHASPTRIEFINLFRDAVFNHSNYSLNLQRIASYKLPGNVFLTIVFGSVTDFVSLRGAIVNAINQSCGGSGGVGGATFNKACQQLMTKSLSTGQAILLGPCGIGLVKVPYIVQASAPNFSTSFEPGEVRAMYNALGGTYTNALDEAKLLEQVAFPLLSTGSCQGEEDIDSLLAIGLNAILQWTKNKLGDQECKLRDIVWCAQTWDDATALVETCDTLMENTVKIARI